MFGDLHDPNSRVSVLSASQRAYRVLEELNTQPAVRYLKLVRHDRPAAAGGERPQWLTASPSPRVPLIGATSRPPTSRATWSARSTPSRRRCGGAAWRCRARRSLLGIGRDRVSDCDRHRHLGPEQDGRVGVRHHELRLLDRHRPRRHAHLGDSVPAPAALAHVGQPGGRSDDAVRRDVRRPLSADPHGPAVDVLLDAALPERPRFALGELPVAARLGLLRDQHLFHDLRDLLVRRPHPRPRDRSRPRAGHDALEDLRLPEPWLDRILPHLASLRGGLPAAGRARHAARPLGPHHRQHRLRDRRGARAGTRRSSRRTSSPAPSSRAWRWC